MNPSGITPLYCREFEASGSVADYPPRWNHPNKKAVFGIACPPGCQHRGTIVVSRWPAFSLPGVLPGGEDTTELMPREDAFNYCPTTDSPTVEWHLNFAASHLFAAYESGLFAQDEMQVAEHPALGSVREALVVSGLSILTVENSRPASICCWLRHPDDFRAAVEEVICLGGDTDTTGAIVGALVGATGGESVIPPEWLAGLLEWPRSVRWMRELAARLAQQAGGDHSVRPMRLFWPGLIARNTLFNLTVLAQGLRRLLPPY